MIIHDVLLKYFPPIDLLTHWHLNYKAHEPVHSLQANALMCVQNFEYTALPLWRSIDPINECAIATMRFKNGVIFSDIINAQKTISHLKKAQFFLNENPISCLVNAWWGKFTCVYVPSGIHLSETIQLLSKITRDATYLSHKIIIYCASGSSLEIFDNIRSLNNKNSIIVRSVEIILEENASLLYTLHQECDNHTKVLDSLNIQLHKGSSFKGYIHVFPGAESYHIINGKCSESGASLIVNGGQILDSDDKCFIAVTQNHSALSTETKTLLKSIVLGAALYNYEGNIVIENGAKKSYADQQNRVFLCGSAAQATSIPNLEAKTDDIYCSHGSAIGQLEPEDLFYIQSRGVNEEASYRLLFENFLSEIACVQDVKKMLSLIHCT